MRRLLAALPLLALGAGCSEPEPGRPGPAAETLIDASDFQGPPVAVVRGEAIPQELLQAYLRLRGRLAADEAAREAAVRELADLLLLAQEARIQGLLERPSARAELAVQRVSTIANLALARFAETHPVTEAEVAAEYAAQAERTGDREYQVRHLLSRSRAEAQALLERLDAGESFAALVAAQRERFGVAAAGELGWVNLAQVPGAFAPALRSLSPGSHTAEPVQSEYGWHVISLQGVRPYEAPALETVAEGIRATLARRKIERHLEELRAEAGVQLDPP